ncbi:unnamed protein product, partial [Rotaria sp. Silwood1]
MNNIVKQLRIDFYKPIDHDTIASSELIKNNHRRKIPQADLASLGLTIQEELITKLISSSSNSTTTNESSISKKTSSITS